MGVVLARTSMSPIVYEVLDFACGITDARAQVVAQTNGLTLFTGTFGPQVESDPAQVRPRRRCAPGDVYMTNNPYEGGTHTCDVCLVKPIFARRASWSRSPSASRTGSRSAARCRAASRPTRRRSTRRGCSSRACALYDEGELNEAIIDMIRGERPPAAHRHRRPQRRRSRRRRSASSACARPCERYGVDARARDASTRSSTTASRSPAPSCARIPNGVYVARGRDRRRRA